VLLLSCVSVITAITCDSSSWLQQRRVLQASREPAVCAICRRAKQRVCSPTTALCQLAAHPRPYPLPFQPPHRHRWLLEAADQAVATAVVQAARLRCGPPQQQRQQQQRQPPLRRNRSSQSRCTIQQTGRTTSTLYTTCKCLPPVWFRFS